MLRSTIAFVASIGLLSAYFAPTAAAQIQLEGSDADKATWASWIAACRNNAYFKSKYDEINASSKIVRGTLERGKKDPGYMVDSFFGGGINMDDLEKFPPGDPAGVVDRCEWILHVLWERYHSLCMAAAWQAAGRGTPGPFPLFDDAHMSALTICCEYRAAKGLPDWVEETKYVNPPDTHSVKMCVRFRSREGPPNEPLPEKTVYYTIKRDQHGAITGFETASIVLPDGGTQKTFRFNATDPNVDFCTVPDQFGGGERVITGQAGEMVLLLEPSVFDDHMDVTVVSYAGDAPSFQIDAAPGQTGPNHLTLDPTGFQFGVLQVSTGHFFIVYQGKIVNDIFPASNPLFYFAHMYGTYDALTGTAEVTTAAELELDDD